MKQNYELVYNGKVVFKHSHFNACVGQAKFLTRHENKIGKYEIVNTETNIKEELDNEILSNPIYR